MSDKKYKVIVSDRTKRMLGTHIRFMVQVNKDAAKTKKQEPVSYTHLSGAFFWFLLGIKKVYRKCINHMV